MFRNIHTIFLLLLLSGGASTLKSTETRFSGTIFSNHSEAPSQTTTPSTSLSGKLFAGLGLLCCFSACLWENKVLYKDFYAKGELKHEAIVTSIACSLFGSLMSIVCFAKLVGQERRLAEFCTCYLPTSLDKMLNGSCWILLIAICFLGNKLFYTNHHTKEKNSLVTVIAFNLCMALGFGISLS